jgi:hypothetical protein
VPFLSMKRRNVREAIAEIQRRLSLPDDASQLNIIGTAASCCFTPAAPWLRAGEECLSLTVAAPARG